MNLGCYGVLSLVCTHFECIPDTVQYRAFISIMCGRGGVQSQDTYQKKWRMMMDLDWFVPVDETTCKVDRETIFRNIMEQGIDVGYFVGDEQRSVAEDISPGSSAACTDTRLFNDD